MQTASADGDVWQKQTTTAAAAHWCDTAHLEQLSVCMQITLCPLKAQSDKMEGRCRDNKAMGNDGVGLLV